MLLAYGNMNFKMLRMMHYHIQFVLENIKAVSNEHCEHFVQQISVIETRYQRNFNSNMMSDNFFSFLQKHFIIQ